MTTDTVKITFLGTGTSGGVPIPGCNCEVCLSPNTKDKRLRCSVLIQTGGKNIVIDSGPDFRYQMLREKVMHLDAIVFTHEHRDHTAGLDDIRAYNFIQEAPVDVYLHQRVMKVLKSQFNYIFESPNYPGIPQINWNLIENKPFAVGNTTLTPIEVMHYKLPVLGFRVGNFTYITDANFISETEIEKIKGTEILVLNALRHEPHISHFNLSEAIELIQKINPSQAYLTHMSHQMGLHRIVSSELPAGIEFAYDGLVVECTGASIA